MANRRGISGVAVALIGTGALLIRSAIRGTSPVQELRGILTGKPPEPLSTTSRGSPLSGGLETGTYQGPGGKGGKARTAGAVSYVAAEAEYIAATWNIVADATLVHTGHIPGSDHYTGHAIDAMVPAGVQGQNIGDAIFTYYKTNAQAKRVKYVIWEHLIWSAARGQHPYRKNDHMNHVHISFF